jgi:hypothetical protein
LCTVPGAEQDQGDFSVSHPEEVHATAHETHVPLSKIGLEPAIGVITERAQVLTGASGAAIALRRGDEVICRARAGRTAPDLGVRLQTDSGVSATTPIRAPAPTGRPANGWA